VIVRLDSYEDSLVFDGRNRLGVRESLRVRGTSVSYELRWGPFRLVDSTFNLFEMKSLLIAAVTPGRPQGVPLSDSDSWREAPKAIWGPGLRFWYQVSAHSIGYSLRFEEAASLGEALLAYDAARRESLGLDAEQGLSDPSQLTGARMAMVQSGLEDTPADRQGRFLG